MQGLTGTTLPPAARRLRVRTPARLGAIMARSGLAPLCIGTLVACALPAPDVGTPPPRVALADSAARHAVANEQALRTSAIEARTIGVTPLAVHASDSTLQPLGYGLADLLLADLSRSRQLRVVDRVRTDAIIRELRLAERGLVDTAVAPRLGRLLRARRLVVGSVADSREARDAAATGRIVIEVRVADAVDGTIAESLSGSSSIDDILLAEKQLAFRIFDLLGVTLTPAERAAVEQRPTRHLGALLAYSRGVRAEAQRDFQSAASEYSAALRLDPTFVAARANLGDVRQAPAEGGQVRRASSTVTSAVNATAIGTGSSAADPAFQSTQRPVGISIEVRIP